MELFKRPNHVVFFVSPFPVVNDLKQRITNTLATAIMLACVWEEFIYHVDICCVTKSACIHRTCMNKNLMNSI